jgi:hypothetical protein
VAWIGGGGDIRQSRGTGFLENTNALLQLAMSAALVVCGNGTRYVVEPSRRTGRLVGGKVYD